MLNCTNSERQFSALAGAVEEYPTGHSLFLIAVDWAYSPSTEIVIAGDAKSDITNQMLKVVREGFYNAPIG
jgi:uncharacterized protein YyaL (SSP411 family)